MLHLACLVAQAHKGPFGCDALTPYLHNIQSTLDPDLREIVYSAVGKHHITTVHPSSGRKVRYSSCDSGLIPVGPLESSSLQFPEIRVRRWRI